MTNTPFHCDLETGICGPGGEEAISLMDLIEPTPKVTLYYATDPICSHCWALEPVFNRFIKQYGHYFNVKTLMGGLLANWHGFADNANGIQKPSDVAHHWREVGLHSRMPIDGSLWHSDPILSSYPPSRVYKVIASIHPGKENEFLRRAREAVFVLNQNIGDDGVLAEIVDYMGLNGRQIVEESGQEWAQQLLEQDFQLSSTLGVKGFPTIIMAGEGNKAIKIVGARSLETYVNALQQLSSHELKARKVPSLLQLLREEQLLFSRELEVMYDVEKEDVQEFASSQLADHPYFLDRIFDEIYFAVFEDAKSQFRHVYPPARQRPEQESRRRSRCAEENRKT